MGKRYVKLTAFLTITASLGGPGAHANLSLIASAGPAKRKEPGLDRTARLQHAQELMGRGYRTSVVRVSGEDVTNISAFVLSATTSALPAAWKPHSERIARAVVREAERYGLDPIFLLAVIKTESGFKPGIVGHHGEIGLMQIRPTTAVWVAQKLNLPWRSVRSLSNPIVNIKIGAAYFAMLREKMRSHGQLYISAYNMGVTNVNRSLQRNVMPAEYSGRVMTRYVNLYRDLGKPVPAPTTTLAAR